MRRKQYRLKEFDYSQNAAYFVTFCTKGKQCVLGHVDIREPGEEPVVVLSPWGRIVEDAIRKIPLCYPIVDLDVYIVMPNHVHLLLIVENPDGQSAPTISRVIQQLKGSISKQIGQPIWQKLFYDHVIRGRNDYEKTWEYIRHNASKWVQDIYYNPTS